MKQNQKGSLIEFASAFDMCLPVLLDGCLVSLKRLHIIHGSNYVHELKEKVKDRTCSKL